MFYIYIYELTQQLFPHAYEKELGLTLSETIGQVDYLLEDGLIEERMNDEGIFVYRQA